MPKLKQAIDLIENAQFLPPKNGDQWYKLIADIKSILREGQDEYDLRMVPGTGPHVVHVETWEKMNTVLDRSADVIEAAKNVIAWDWSENHPDCVRDMQQLKEKLEKL